MRITNFTRKLAVLLLVAHLTGCLTPEETTTVETASSGVPTNGQTDFTVTPGDDQSSQSSDSGASTNPDMSGPNAPPTDPEEDELNTVNLIINNGDTHTSGSTLAVELIAPPSFSQMRLGRTNDCSDGTWTDKTSQTTAPVLNPNSIQMVSVQLKDFDNRLSDCVVKTIIHDNAGPEILIKKYPTESLEEGATAEIIAEVTDVSGVNSVTCSLNGLTKTCHSGTNTLNLSAMPVGSYTLTIEAKDKLGLSSSRSVSWSVVSTIKNVTQNISVGNERKFDILVVVDNSGSMNYEQSSMASRVGNMLSILRGLDYQIGVTTTDPRSYVAWGDGKLLPIQNTNKYWIDSTMNETTAQQNLGLTIQRSETGSALEQGILTTYRMLERSIAGENAGFLRPDAKLAVILISDEDESANTSRNDPENLMRLISNNWSNKTFSFHSIITKPGDTACKSTHGAAEGHRYAKLSGLTGGIIGSVCEADYANQVSGIATDIRNMLKNITLTCKPVQGTPVTIKKDGVLISETPVLDGLTLKFNEPLSIGSYEIKYTCLK